MVSVASDHAALVLAAVHRLAFATAIHASARPIPADVVAAPDIVLSLSGSHDCVNIPPKTLAQSHIANHLVQYLRTNAAQLGLDYVSDILHDQQDDTTKLIIRSGRPSSLQLQRLPTCATLLQLDLAYTWQTQHTKTNMSPLADPFSPILSLPYQTLLDAAVERFVNRDLVKRYPLIFGFWRRQLDIEATFFPVIYRSIHRIIDRSPNSVFKERCDQLFMALRRNILSKTAQNIASLSEAVLELDFCLDSTSISESDILCLAMERLFQAGVQPPKFKGSIKGPTSDRAEDEELTQKMSQCSPDDTKEPSQNILWELHSEDTPVHSNDSMGESPHSSYEQFPFGLYEAHLFQTNAHQTIPSEDVKPDLPPIGSSILDWDSDIDFWKIFGASVQASQPDTVFLEDYNAPNNQEQLDLNDDLIDEDYLHPMKGDKVILTEEGTQDNTSGPLACDDWATENLFAHDDRSRPEGEHHVDDHSFSGRMMFDNDDDTDVLSEGSTESITSILDLGP
ncbi:hypothetical protein APHAL10511_008320 [Amanita phalloides]|nr:hypothetical protein APHAL10511_008320 [Amanita phalloides]